MNTKIEIIIEKLKLLNIKEIKELIEDTLETFDIKNFKIKISEPGSKLIDKLFNYIESTLFRIDTHPTQDLFRIQIDKNFVILNTEQQKIVYKQLKEKFEKESIKSILKINKEVK